MGPNAPAVTEDSDKSSSISQDSVVVDVIITYIIAENSTRCDRSKLVASFGFSYTLKSTQIQHTGTVAYGAVTLSTEHLWCKMVMVTSTFLGYLDICMVAQATHHHQQDWWQRSRKERLMTYLSPPLPSWMRWYFKWSTPMNIRAIYQHGKTWPWPQIGSDRPNSQKIHLT